MSELLHLDPKRKYVDAVADAIAARARPTPAGAVSLAHVLVVVPTAESGRRLRLALARRFAHGCVPPTVRMPALLLAAGENVASPVRELGELAKLLASLRPDDFPDLFPRLPEPRTEDWCVGLAVQLADLWRILGANALAFADVAAKVGEVITTENADVEIARWRDLAALEARFFGLLHEAGLVHRLEAMQGALAQPNIPAGTEEIYLACAGEEMPAVRQIKWPVEPVELAPGDVRTVSLSMSDIFPSGTAGEEAKRIGRYLAGVGAEEALPAICLADAEMFPELHGAAEANGLKLHDPSRQLVKTSSLGHLVSQILALFRSGSYTVFSAFIRGGDVQRWLGETLDLDEGHVVGAIRALDELQAERLPETLRDVASFATGDLKRVSDLVAERVDAKAGLSACRTWLAEIFGGRRLADGAAEDEEFAAAAQAVNDLFADFDGVDGLGRMELPLFEKVFETAAYSLEPDVGEVIRTDGWLELPFLEADEVVIAGFQDGAVPENVVGHPFLPDGLRQALGLPSNGQRAARDAKILAGVCAARPEGAVKVFFHAVDAQGNVLKPSRLLFLTDDDKELAKRVKAYYRDKVGTEADVLADLPESWRLDLPLPEVGRLLEHVSPSSLGDYLTCPFTYYLKRLFGEPMDDRAEELDPARFGTLCHAALERWSRGELRESEDAAAIADELARQVDALLQEDFGANVPAIVALQGESAKRRLAHFAAEQVRRHAEGWRIVATERDLTVKYGHTAVHGRCDRIDFNPTTGAWCVIDYKVYDTLDRAAWYETSAKAIAFATEVRGFEAFTVPGDGKKPKTAVWKSVQLPLYCAMLDAAGGDLAAAKRDQISSCYCVLGKTADDTGFTAPMNGAYVADAERLIARLIAGIEAGVFWPPSPTDAWRWDFGKLIFNVPAESVRATWIADQLARADDLPRGGAR